jgi:ABC-type bacteriocin/lantibiotic exporter with double-glycine peptidase domain
LYEPTSGSIYIDDVDISTIDPNYIRENITYVNQNSRLFDKKIIENMVYGCNSLEACQTHLKEIMRYPKIRQLYKNVDVLNGKAGSLGENLSGGQRQVVNIISGLINPSKILILDEPTNALDADLKNEVLAMIQHFRQYKQCIIIITHDRDVYSLFDETLQI